MLPLSYHAPQLLWFLLAVPAVGVIVAPLLKKRSALSLFGFGIALTNLFLSFVLLRAFDPTELAFQCATNVPLISSLGVQLALGVDGLSIWMVIFTNILMMLAVYQSKHVEESLGGYLSLLFLLQLSVLGTFLALDLVLYYFFWELMLIPNFLLLYRWGTERRVALKYALYTALGSFLMLVSIISLGVLAQEQRGGLSFFVGDLVGLMMTTRMGDLLLVGFLAAFFLKSAVFPFHTWLPDAHRAAPPGGSFDLTLVLPKVGLFGAIRFVYLLLPDPMVRHETFLGVLGVIGLLYGALVAWQQTDLKRFLAYSTVSHVGLSLIGLASLSEEGVKGCVFLMLGSGIATGGLLMLVADFEKKNGVHHISSLSGLAATTPRLALLFSLFVMASIGVPVTNGFIGEFFALAGAFDSNSIIGLVAVLGVIFGALYALSLYRRVFFGERLGEMSDIESSDFVPLIPLIALVFVVGLYPKPVLLGVEHSLDLMESVQENSISDVTETGEDLMEEGENE